MIRPLDPVTDRAAVEAFFSACAAYIRLARDAGPGPEVTDEFFTDTPPGCDVAQNLRVGLFAGSLIGVADMAFGYPTADDAYIGLMMISPAARGLGAGQTLLRHLAAAGQDIPRKRGPDVTRSDLLMVNKTDLAPSVGLDPTLLEVDTKVARGPPPDIMAPHPAGARGGGGGGLAWRRWWRGWSRRGGWG